MFTAHFNLTTHPFAEPAPVADILQDERISEALARLEYLAAQGTVGLVTGATGLGKSSLVRLFVRGLSTNRFLPAYIHLTQVNASSLLKLIVRTLGERPGCRGKQHLFVQIFDKVRQNERTSLLIVDEAHLLSSEALTDLRLLVSDALDESPRLKLLLVGQDALAHTLQRHGHLDLLHRINVRCHLHPLSPEQSASYIDFRVRKAGGSDKIFEPEAKTLIHEYTGGVPRQINNVATACLLNAAARNTLKVNEPLVSETLREFRLP